MHVVEATREHFLGEGDKVGRCAQIPMFMCPELTCAANSGLHLISDKENSKFCGKIAHTLSEFIRQRVIAAFRLNRLHDDSNDFFSLFILPLVNLGSNISQGLLVLIAIVLDVVLKRILVDRVLGSRPVKSGDINLVHGLGS